MNTDRIAVETPEEKEALDAITSCTCAKDKRIAELESYLFSLLGNSAFTTNLPIETGKLKSILEHR